MPRMESGYGSLSALRVSMTAVCSLKSIDCFRSFEGLLPMEDGFLRRTCDLGLSTVDADEPETRDGVRAYATSGRPAREDDVGSIDLACATSGSALGVLAEDSPVVFFRRLWG